MGGKIDNTLLGCRICLVIPYNNFHNMRKGRKCRKVPLRTKPARKQGSNLQGVPTTTVVVHGTLGAIAYGLRSVALNK